MVRHFPNKSTYFLVCRVVRRILAALQIGPAAGPLKASRISATNRCPAELHRDSGLGNEGSEQDSSKHWLQSHETNGTSY